MPSAATFACLSFVCASYSFYSRCYIAPNTSLPLLLLDAAQSLPLCRSAALQTQIHNCDSDSLRTTVGASPFSFLALDCNARACVALFPRLAPAPLQFFAIFCGAGQRRSGAAALPASRNRQNSTAAIKRQRLFPLSDWRHAFQCETALLVFTAAFACCIHFLRAATKACALVPSSGWRLRCALPAHTTIPISLLPRA